MVAVREQEMKIGEGVKFATCACRRHWLDLYEHPIRNAQNELKCSVIPTRMHHAGPKLAAQLSVAAEY